MKQVIDRKLYNTETATCVAEYETGGSVNDLGWYEESLYRTKNGRWFVATITTYHGASLRTLTGGEAMQWLEDKSEIDTIEEHFAAQIEEG